MKTLSNFMMMIWKKLDLTVEYGTKQENKKNISMRARKFYQRTGRKIIIDGSNTAGYDKSKVECFNCHKMGHFSRECRAPRSKDNRNWNQGSSTKTVKIEDASEKAMCAIDGAGFYWSDMAEEKIQANMALMAFSDSEVKNDKSCSKNCLKNYEALKKQYDDLLVKSSDTDFKAATYKRGLATLEGQIVKYREHEVLFSEEIALLKRSVGSKEYELGLLRTELEKIKQEKEGVDFKIEKFDKSAKDLNEMLESHITDKSKKGVEYHVLSPNESPLHAVHSCRSDEGSLKLIELMNLVTKLSKRIGVLEDDLKRIKQTYNAAFTKLILKIKKLESKVKTGKARKRARVVLSEDEEDDSSKQGMKISDIDEDPNTYFAQDDDVVHDTTKERLPGDSTAGIIVSTAGRVVYGRRSKEARKDKGKAIMTEPEPEKKTKESLLNKKNWFKEAIRLQEQVNEEERAQKARDEEIARQLLALDEERVTTETKTTKDIDWNDHSIQKKEEETKSTAKKQKVEQDDEKEEIKNYLDIVPREDVGVDVESLSTKYPIVDWKTYTLPENFMYYKIIRGDGSSKNYKETSEISHSADAKWNCHTYAYRKEVSTKSRNDIKDADYINTTPQKRAYFDAEAEAIHMILSGIGYDIYSIVDACTTDKEMWIAIKRLQQGESLNKQDVKTNLFWEFARNANPLALVAIAQQYPDDHYQAPKPHKTYVPSSKQTPSTKSHALTRSKGKEIAKPITPPSKSASEEEDRSYVVQQSGIQCFNCKEFGYFAKECRKPKRAKDYAYHKEKMMLCKQEEKGVPLRAEQGDCLDDTNDKPDEQELEAHYMYMAKIHEVLTVDSRTTFDVEPLEKVQFDDDYNVFATERQHSEQRKSIDDTYVVEMVDSNVIPDSSDMCDDEEIADQNAKVDEDEHSVLASLIANLNFDIDENKKIQKQLKKANAPLTHELHE
ncbi:retrovirus-related pol polyprotein from transposon TNT 1-94 [Tanacetum coccineum]